jgi:hypothetical protein
MALKDFDFDKRYWWSLFAAAGAAIAVRSISDHAVFLIGLGLMFFGAGQTVNRPQKTEIFRGDMVGSYITKRTNPWKPKRFGLVLEGIGILLFVVGLSAFFFKVPFAP